MLLPLQQNEPNSFVPPLQSSGQVLQFSPGTHTPSPQERVKIPHFPVGASRGLLGVVGLLGEEPGKVGTASEGLLSDVEDGAP